MEEHQCLRILEDGTRCTAIAIAGSNYCDEHQPPLRIVPGARGGGGGGRRGGGSRGGARGGSRGGGSRGGGSRGGGSRGGGSRGGR